MAYKYNPPTAYDSSINRADILREFNRWDDQAGQRVVTEYKLPKAERPLKAGVEATVEFVLRGERRRVRVDRWHSFDRNYTCCALIIRDMRLAEARGLTEAIREAYGLLEAPKSERDPYEVLGVGPGTTAEVIRLVFRAKAKALHPDTGGDSADPKALQELQAAYERLTGDKP